MRSPVVGPPRKDDGDDEDESAFPAHPERPLNAGTRTVTVPSPRSMQLEVMQDIGAKPTRGWLDPANGVLLPDNGGVGGVGDGENSSFSLDYGNTQVMWTAPTFNEMSMIKTVVLSLMFVISLIGNTATLLQMYRMRRRRSTINTLILHLATADLIVTFFCNVTDAVWASTVQWYGGNALCKVVKFLQVFGLYLSTYIIVIISVDRCYAILDPMSRNNAAKRVRLLIALAWFLSALFSLPQSYIFRLERGPFVEEFYQCVTYGAYNEKWQEQLYSCLSVLFMFVIPLVSMITAYMLIFCTIAKKSRDLQNEVETTTDMLSRGPMRGKLFRKAKVKSLRMTALIVAAFIVCWTPYYVMFIIFTFYDHRDIDTKASIWIFFFGMANSMVNPLIYGAFHICKKRRREQCPLKYPREGPARTTCTTKTTSSSRSPRALAVGGGTNPKFHGNHSGGEWSATSASYSFTQKRYLIVSP